MSGSSACSLRARCMIAVLSPGFIPAAASNKHSSTKVLLVGGVAQRTHLLRQLLRRPRAGPVPRQRLSEQHSETSEPAPGRSVGYGSGADSGSEVCLRACNAIFRHRSGSEGTKPALSAGCCRRGVMHNRARLAGSEQVFAPKQHRHLQDEGSP